MKKVIYTAIMGDYDSVKTPAVVDSGVEYILFTDNPKLKSEVWNVKCIPSTGLPPRKLARKVKLRPDLYLPQDTEKSIWIDGSMHQVASFKPLFNEDIDFITVIHPQRDCVYEEAKACVNFNKISPDAAEEQMQFYRDKNYPKNGGMIDSSMLVRKHTDAIFSLGKMWYEQIENFTVRDQLGFPWAILNHEEISRKHITVKDRTKYIRQYGHMNPKQLNRIGIIQRLINKHKFSRYLEIGVGAGTCIHNVFCDVKEGVDPNPQARRGVIYTKHRMPSDKFFETNTEKYDIIFVDGLHNSDQVYRDIVNGLDILNENGRIVCHDMLPHTEKMQRVPRVQNEWTGDCWKAWVKLRSERSDLEMYVVDTDYGCGVIQKGSQECIARVADKDLTWQGFCKNKEEWMNIKSVDEFDEIIDD